MDKIDIVMVFIIFPVTLIASYQLGKVIERAAWNEKIEDISLVIGCDGESLLRIFKRLRIYTKEYALPNNGKAKRKAASNLRKEIRKSFNWWDL